MGYELRYDIGSFVRLYRHFAEFHSVPGPDSSAKRTSRGSSIVTVLCHVTTVLPVLVLLPTNVPVLVPPRFCILSDTTHATYVV